MEFLDKEQLKVRNAKHDRSIFLYTVIVLIPCFAMMVASFVLAYFPISFKAQGGESGFTVSRIGFYNAYVDGTPRYSNFDFGWLNVFMIVACAVVGLLMIITIYLNFFVAHKTIMNRYAYMFCIAVILGIVFANIFGQLCGKYTDAPENENFFPIFFMTEGTDLSSEAVTYKLNEGGITMLSFSVIFFAVMFVMIPLWLYVANKTGRINKNTGDVLMMKKHPVNTKTPKQKVVKSKVTHKKD